MTEAQKKAFLDELSKIEGRPVSKLLNQLLFQPSNEEVSGLVGRLAPPQPAAPQPQQQQPGAAPPAQQGQPNATAAAPAQQPGAA